MPIKIQDGLPAIRTLEDENIFLKDKLTDCGMLIYDRKTQDVHCGGSGCGCIASVLSAYFLKQIEEQKVVENNEVVEEETTSKENENEKIED